MKNRTIYAALAVMALLGVFVIGPLAASNFSMSMRAPTANTNLQQLGVAGVASSGDSGYGYTVTDPKSAQALLNYGWVNRDAGYFTVNWDGALGNFTSSAQAPMKAPCTGHFISNTCDAVLTGACSAGPVIVAKDVTAAVSGLSITAGTTVASPVATTGAVKFTAGDTVALAMNATPSACVTPVWHCQAVGECTGN